MNDKDLTIILVHGALGDESHWRKVIPILVKKGYTVRSVQNALTSLDDDITTTTDMINKQEGKVLLVGHSYGGMVISAAGNNDKVVGLVYIAALAPDAGESIAKIFGRRAEAPGAAHLYPDDKGFLWLKYDKFHSSFCQDLDEDSAMAMSLAQNPWHSSAMEATIEIPAWKNKPTWYQISDSDRIIPPETEKEMAERMKPKKTIHLDSGHASMASRPKEVADLILEAASTF